MNSNSDIPEDAIESLFPLQLHYYTLLKDIVISKGFSKQLYTDSDSVMEIIKICITELTEMFELWCEQNFKSPKDIGQILWLYSLYERDVNYKIIKLSEPVILALYTCRYILAIAPKLKLSKNSEEFFKTRDVCLPELFSISNCLGILSQFRAVEGLSSTPAVQIDLTKSFLDIKYLSPELNSQLQKSKSKGEKIISPQFIDYSYIRDCKVLFIDVFGDAAESIFDVIDQSQPDQDQIIPKDFTPYLQLYGKSIFAQELILTRDSVNLFNVITKPHLTGHRTRFRPLIELTIDGSPFLVSTKWVLFEAFAEIIKNRLPFHGLPNSWLKNKKIREFADSINNEVGVKFEKEVAKRIASKFPFKYDVKSIGDTSIEDFPILENGVPTGRKVGQIDFIIINRDKKIIFIADAKYLKSKYITASFFNDKSKFDEYYKKLQDKLSWAKNNKSLISELFGFNVNNYVVKELFITDAYIFYSLFVPYPIIPVIAINDYISTSNRYCYIGH